MLTRTVPPAPILDVNEAKRHLRIVHNREDELIADLIVTATEYLDGPSGVVGQCLGAQTWAYTTAGFSNPLRLPIGPVSSVSSVTYLDPDGETQSASGFYLHADALGPYLKLLPASAWPATLDVDNAVTVTFVAGHAAVPRPIQSAALLIVAHLWENREVQASVETFPTGFGLWDLIAPYRRVF